MVIVMVILVALLGAGAVAMYVQVSDTRAAGLIKQSRDALYCAEAGLAAARGTIADNYAMWPVWLDGDPSNDGPYPLVGDIDGDGTDDYEVTIMDNDDELAGSTNDPTRDNDLKVFVVSLCTKYEDSTPREVLEMVSFQSMGNLYRNQAGQGSSNTGNRN
jgi:hypothetical protein